MKTMKNTKPKVDEFNWDRPFEPYLEQFKDSVWGKHVYPKADPEKTKVADSDYKSWLAMWKNAGVLPDMSNAKKPLTILDAMAHYSAPLYLQKMNNDIVTETVEPMLVITNLMTRIPWFPGITLGGSTIGAIGADFDMAEGEEYPDASLQVTRGTMTATVGKQGFGLSFTEEALLYSNMPIIDMHTREVLKAMARFKEQKAIRLLQNVGRVTHDNTTPSASVYGCTTGRGLDGAPNGSVTADDIFECMYDLMYAGYMPNVWLIHPLTWLMFVRDPVMRNVVNQSGVGTYFQGWNGLVQFKEFPEDPIGVSNGRELTDPTALNGTKSGVAAYANGMNSAPSIPGYFGIAGRFNIIVSPFMTFDTTNNLCDIIIADSNELGYHVVAEGLTTEDWIKPENDTLRIKFKERYSFMIKNEGKGVRVMKDVKIVPNQIILPAQAQVSVQSSALADVTRSSSPL